jgi:Uma2 family endonuclease
MAGSTTTTLMTADDLLQMPDDGRQHELVRGRLVTMSATSSRPAIVATRIGLEVGLFVRQHHLGEVAGADWGFRLQSDPDTVRAPDFAFVRAERIPPEGVPPGFWPGAPDLALEVISPSDRFGAVMEKVDEYLDAGTRMVVVVDPEKRITRVFRPDRPMRVLGPDDELDGDDVLPGFTLPLSQVWV